MDIELIDMVIIPVVVGLCEVAKRLGFAEKFIPLLSIVLGIVGGYFFITPCDLPMSVLQGLVMGLTAVGLYSAPKNIYEGMVE